MCLWLRSDPLVHSSLELAHFHFADPASKQTHQAVVNPRREKSCSGVSSLVELQVT